MRYIVLLLLIIFISCERDKDILPEEEPVPAAQNYGKLSVIVYDATEWTPAQSKGKPAAGMTVYLFHSQSDFAATWQHPDNPKYAFEAITGSNGAALFDSLPPGKYYISTQDMVDASNTFYFQSEFRKELRNDGLVWGLSSDSLIQSTSVISPQQPYAFPGTFAWKDLNADGAITNQDFQPLPQRNVVIQKQGSETIQLLKGVQGDSYYQTLFQIVNGSYATLSQIKEKQVMADAYMSQNALPAGQWALFRNFTFNPSTSLINDIWSEPWKAINNCNYVIGINQANIPLPLQHYVWQSKLLRAAAYLGLVTTFGDVPLMTTYNSTDFYPPRQPANDIINYVVGDIAGFINEMPEVFQHNGYLNRWSGLTILAKLQLAQKDYAAVLQSTNAIINSRRYELTTSANEVYQNTTNKEIIWNGMPEPTTAFKTYFQNRPVFPDLRYAEVLLLNAEAHIRLGNINQAQAVLNQLQSRSSRTPVVLTSANALEQLNQVTQQEAPLEGYHFSSMVRWELAGLLLSTQGYKAHNKLLPIPLNQVLINPNMTQNPGY
ncbi:RagB/SusD family nutrient uptake outer membrane protein [Niabella hibiscisoli]|uniref:RagB/SusD family nutrient uptake outer membrane protein n=1 Tax=Niabella hibiscisoli TaxID=1825928 RepID=UPI001F1135EC|nr:RagB/SusD family nutrient uptake outer membrane protein [Niabella hibiscisoli]MCH5721388.1 RagB/SusD family nutrient uptake outer membrane protein [Niabella hibiscisoli]